MTDLVLLLGSGAFAADMLATERNVDRNSSSRLDKMNIHIGSKTFISTLYDNRTVSRIQSDASSDFGDERAKR